MCTVYQSTTKDDRVLVYTEVDFNRDDDVEKAKEIKEGTAAEWLSKKMGMAKYQPRPGTTKDIDVPDPKTYILNLSTMPTEKAVESMEMDKGG